MIQLRSYQEDSLNAIRACIKCGIEKAVSDFYKRENGRLRTWCKLCWNEKNKAWNKQNPERRKAILDRWNKNNPDNIKKRKATYRARHPIHYRKWSLDNPERKKELNKAWADRNKPRRAESTAKRRATLKQAIPKWADHRRIRNIYQDAATTGHEVDHIVPLQSKIVCGLHCEHNLVLLDMSVNRAKSNRYWPDMP